MPKIIAISSYENNSLFFSVDRDHKFPLHKTLHKKMVYFDISQIYSTRETFFQEYIFWYIEDAFQGF